MGENVLVDVGGNVVYAVWGLVFGVLMWSGGLVRWKRMIRREEIVEKIANALSFSENYWWV